MKDEWMLKNNWNTYSENMLNFFKGNSINLVYVGDKMLKLEAKNFKEKKGHVKK